MRGRESKRAQVFVCAASKTALRKTIGNQLSRLQKIYLFKLGPELALKSHPLLMSVSNVKAVISHYTIFANNKQS